MAYVEKIGKALVNQMHTISRPSMITETDNRLTSTSREPTYQAARAVAAPMEAHFARHLAAARERGEEELAPEPDAQAIEAIIDATFWASLRREEGHSPKIS